MNKIVCTLLLVLLSSSLFIQSSYCQWQPDVRLTNSSGSSITSTTNVRCVATNGNISHIVWSDNRDGNYEIYYKRSSDGGASWGIDTRLTNNSGWSENPSIAVSGSVVHVTWLDNFDGNEEIYYKRSTDGGITWGSDNRMTNNISISAHPIIEVNGLPVHIVWQDNRDGNFEIYYKNSTDGGTTWGTDTRLTNNTFHSEYPNISVFGTMVHVFWDDNRDGNTEIYYKRSTDGGLTWGNDTRLTNDGSNSYLPSSAISSSQVHVVWYDNRDGNNEIYYKHSTDGGLTWGTDTRLTNNSYDSYRSTIPVSGSDVHVVWYDTRDGNNEIYYKQSTNDGANWNTDTRLTDNSFESYRPSISVFGKQINVVWCDTRDGNFEIYYKCMLPIPTVPTLISPLNNSVSQPLNLNLIWNKAQYCTKYRLLLATDSLFTNVIINDSLLTDSIKTLTNLNPLTHYYWKVSAGNSAGWSAYSSFYKFKTIGIPTQVNLSTPSNNAVNQQVIITFKWFKAIDQTIKSKTVSDYWLEYSVDSNFVSGVVKDSTLTDTTKSVSGLNTITKYYWRVKAKNQIGWGTFSSIWNFTTVPPVPNAPILVSPLNNSTAQPLNLNLIWNRAQYSTKYRLLLATDSLFNTVLINDSLLIDSIKSLTNLNPLTNYYWKASAGNSAGWSSYSAVYKFTTAPSIPLAPVLISPLNNATNQVPNLLLDWGSVVNAASYRIQIANDSLFNSLVFDTSNVNRDSLRVRLGLLIVNTKYYWRVNATNITGTGPWSSVWNFRISPVGIIISGNEIPNEFRLYNNYPNPFNPTTKIHFDIPLWRGEGGRTVTLKIFDAMGREVQTLVNESLKPGTYEASFDGSMLTSGVYFYKLMTDGFTETKRMMLIK